MLSPAPPPPELLHPFAPLFSSHSAHRHLMGIGIDLVSTARLETSLRLHRFRQRVYAPEEQAAFQVLEGQSVLVSEKSLDMWASAFALKEAALKALGTGWAQGVELHEVVTQWKPGTSGLEQAHWTVVLTGRALEHATRLNVTHLDAACSRDGGRCLATVWMWGDLVRYGGEVQGEVRPGAQRPGDGESSIVQPVALPPHVPAPAPGRPRE